MRPETETQTLDAHLQDITSFLAHYQSTETEDAKRTALKHFLTNTIWLIRITPIEFGVLAAELSSSDFKLLDNHIQQLQPTFLKDSTEFAHACIAIKPEKIPHFCNNMLSIFERRRFIVNAREFSAWFSPHFFLTDGSKHKGLTPEQISSLYTTLLPIIKKESFFASLEDFVVIFLALPSLTDKTTLFAHIEKELPELVEKTKNILNLAKQLQTNNENEKPFFLMVRDRIFNQFAKNHKDPIEVFFAMLFLIADNYPGGQPDKLQNVINHAIALSLSSDEPIMITQITALTKLKIDEEKISSTRLKLAISQLIENIENNTAIEFTYIRGLAQDKNTTRVRFFQPTPKEVEIESMPMQKKQIDHKCENGALL